MGLGIYNRSYPTVVRQFKTQPPIRKEREVDKPQWVKDKIKKKRNGQPTWSDKKGKLK